MNALEISTRSRLESYKAENALQLSALETNKTLSPNLFNTSTMTAGYFADRTTGNLVAHPALSVSDYIPVIGDSYYDVSGTTQQCAWYDTDRVFISGVLTVGAGIYAPPTASFLRQSILNTDANIQVKKTKLLGVLTVAKSGRDYTTITEAINNAQDSVDNPVTILIYPGVYLEQIDIVYGRYISLIGVNKDTCIIRKNVAVPANDPLTFEGIGRVENLTVICTRDDMVDPGVNDFSYAMHSDSSTGLGGLIEVHNCVLMSDSNAGYGLGMMPNQTVKITNCEFVSTNIATGAMANGSFIVHSCNKNSDNLNQHLFVKDCYFRSANGNVMQIADIGTGTVGMDVTFLNNTGWSDTSGAVDSTINFNGGVPTTGNLVGAINLTGYSHGNNIAKLNA